MAMRQLQQTLGEMLDESLQQIALDAARKAVIELREAQRRDREKELRERMPEKRAVTESEAAWMLSLSERKIRSMVASGELPVLRMDNGHVRIRVADLDAWLDGQMEGSHA